MTPLRVLQLDIDQRVAEMVTSRGEWPCRKGCDACCRRLAAVPMITCGEWELLERGLTALPDRERAQVASRLEQAGPPFTCPFLDEGEGACMVYDYRPIACRTYGFYVERDRGLYCAEILSGVDAGEFEGVVWGNAGSVEARLTGERVDLFAMLTRTLRGPKSAALDPIR